MNRDVLNLFGGVAAVVGLVGSCALMTTFSSSRSSSPSPQSPITCTATIPATKAGRGGEVVFTGRRGGDGYNMDLTGLRPSQEVEIYGSRNPNVNTTRFQGGQHYDIKASVFGGQPSIDTLGNAKVTVAEGGEYTQWQLPVICPERG